MDCTDPIADSGYVNYYDATFHGTTTEVSRIKGH